MSILNDFFQTNLSYKARFICFGNSKIDPNNLFILRTQYLIELDDSSFFIQ